MYNFKNWVDRVTQFVNRFKETNNSDGSITHERVDGEVLKTGTSQSAANFNNMEGGILENSLILAEDTRVLKEHGRDIDAMTGEMHVIYLYNTAKYPANNSKTTIALKQPRNNTDYIIAARVVSAVMPVLPLMATRRARPATSSSRTSCSTASRCSTPALPRK